MGNHIPERLRSARVPLTLFSPLPPSLEKKQKVTHDICVPRLLVLVAPGNGTPNRASVLEILSTLTQNFAVLYPVCTNAILPSTKSTCWRCLICLFVPPPPRPTSGHQLDTRSPLGDTRACGL